VIKIVHLSDIHINGLEYVKEWGENVIRRVNEEKPDILVISGDLTNDGYIHEYKAIKAFINRMHVKNKIIVPGNHDARNEGYVIFEEFFGDRFPIYEDEELVILGLDSSEPDIDDGHIGRENYPLIERTLKGRENKVKIVTLHHHLIPIPGTGRERNIPIDAGDVLALLTKLGVNLVLSGHKHKPWIWMLENTYFITAGTATTRRLKGLSYPSFNVIIIEENYIIVREVNVKENTTRQIMSVKR